MPCFFIPARDSCPAQVIFSPAVPFLSHVPSSWGGMGWEQLRKEAALEVPNPGHSLFPDLPVPLGRGRRAREVGLGGLTCVRGRSNGDSLENQGQAGPSRGQQPTS